MQVRPTSSLLWCATTLAVCEKSEAGSFLAQIHSKLGPPVQIAGGMLSGTYCFRIHTPPPLAKGLGPRPWPLILAGTRVWKVLEASGRNSQCGFFPGHR